jgi:hypothetical protein
MLTSLAAAPRLPSERSIRSGTRLDEQQLPVVGESRIGSAEDGGRALVVPVVDDVL